MTNESKVVRYDFVGQLFVPTLNGDYVTHADYKALEEDHAELRIAYDAEYKRCRLLEEELASLRERVVTLEGNIEAHKERGGLV